MSIIERAIRKLNAEDVAPEPIAAPAPPAVAPAPDKGTRGQAPAGAQFPRPVAIAPAPAQSRYGEIDLARLRAAGMIMPDSAKTQLSEEFRVIKRPLLNNAFGRGAVTIPHGNLIMVTSALPREGKSFCAFNLAMSIALERDHTVLLVDADVAKPRGAGILGLGNGPGLMDLLLDPAARLEEVMLRTNVDKLDVLLAGRSDPHATELLASEAMARLLAQMAQRHPDRMVIFDAPPLLVTTEACALAQLMGQIVLVIEAASTTQAAVKEALSQIDKCNVLGLLNKGSGALGENPFNYGAYGGYDTWRA